MVVSKLIDIPIRNGFEDFIYEEEYNESEDEFLNKKEKLGKIEKKNASVLYKNTKK